MRILVLDDSATFARTINNTGEESYEIQYEGKYNFYKSLTYFKKFKYVFYRNYYDELNQLSALKAMQAGIRVVFFNDGIFEWSNAYRNSLGVQYCPLIATDVFTVSAFDKYFIDHHNPIFRPNNYQYIPANALTHEALTMKKHTDFLISTANTAYSNEAEYDALLKTLSYIIEALTKIEYSFSYRIFDPRLINDLKISAVDNMKDGDFGEIIKQYGALITTPSTIAVTAMQLEIPTALVQYRDAPITFSTGWNIIFGLNVSKTLKSLYEGDTERMQFQNMQLQGLNSQGENFNSVVNQLENHDLLPPQIDIDKYVDQRYFDLKFMFLKILKTACINLFKGLR